MLDCKDMELIMEEIEPKTEYQVFRNWYTDSILAYNNNNLIEQIPILEASMSQPLKHIYSGAPIMFVSAFKNKLDIKTNKERTKILIRILNDSGYFYIPFSGYWTAYDKENKKYSDEAYYEESFMVVGLNKSIRPVDFETFRAFALKLIHKFEQDCILIGRADDYSLEHRYKDVPITFGFLNENNELANVFTELHFDKPERVKAIHDLYIEKKNVDNDGFAHTTSKKGNHTFRMMNKDEAEVRTDYYNSLPRDNKTGMIKSNWVISTPCLNKRDNVINVFQTNPKYIEIAKKNNIVIY